MNISNIGKNIYVNLDVKELLKKALDKKEGTLANNGALVIYTGKYTGRSPNDKFIVDTPSVHNDIAWGKVNKPISNEKFENIKNKALKYLTNKDLYVFNGFAGADKKHRKKFTIINEYASQNLFIHQLLVRPSEDELANFGTPDYTILVAPGFKCNPEVDGVNSEAAIIINYESHEIVIVGTAYCGEIKKSVFSTMNYVLTKENVLPMHCSANKDPLTDETAIFFGLSGTGKTTLSADSNRKLIGDDEHGWSNEGVFNIEGGCYAKCINLSKENEPDIYNAIKEGAVVENVVMNEETKELDFFDSRYTENTRVAYPINYINNAELKGTGGIPKVVIFLTADAFGVLPPISKLDKNAAMYHFVSGFTSKLAGTERGVLEPQPTFSTLFGEPFMPMSPAIYAQMLGDRLDKYGTKVYLINTGWSGGSASSGAKRIKLSYTRAMVNACLNGDIEKETFKHSDIFNVDFPTKLPGVPSEILDPKEAWEDKEAYDKEANKLALMFNKNFNEKYLDMPEEIKNAGPRIIK